MMTTDTLELFCRNLSKAKNDLTEYDRALLVDVSARLCELQRRIAQDDKARPYSIGATVFWLPSDGVLKDHIIEIVVHGYSESAWQGSKNIGKDHRFIICHNSYNEPHAYPLKECYTTRQEAGMALNGGGQRD